MRKALPVIGVLGVLAFGIVTLVTPVNAAIGNCTYRCICSVPHRCCTVNGVTTCKPDRNGPLQCTQVQNC